MSIQLSLSEVGITLAGDGVSVSVDVDLEKLAPNIVQAFPTTKIKSVVPQAVSGGLNLPTVSLKGSVATFTFDTPPPAANVGANTGITSLVVALTFETD